MKSVVSLVSATVLVFMFAGCDFGDSGGITPPEWIIGTWSYSDDSGTITWIFTSNNAVFNNISDYSQINELPGITVSSEGSPTTFRLTQSGGGTIIRVFEKTSDTTLNYTSILGSHTTDTIQLNKQ